MDLGSATTRGAVLNGYKRSKSILKVIVYDIYLLIILSRRCDILMASMTISIDAFGFS